MATIYNISGSAQAIYHTEDAGATVVEAGAGYDVPDDVVNDYTRDGASPLWSSTAPTGGPPPPPPPPPAKVEADSTPNDPPASTPETDEEQS